MAICRVCGHDQRTGFQCEVCGFGLPVVPPAGAPVPTTHAAPRIRRRRPEPEPIRCPQCGVPTTNVKCRGCGVVLRDDED